MELPSPDRSRTSPWRLETEWFLTPSPLVANPPRQHPNPIPRARLYAKALADQDASYADVAKQHGVTREEVCHYVTLLKRLPADMIARVEDEAAGRKRGRLSLRKLLGIARLDDEQAKWAAFDRIAAG